MTFNLRDVKNTYEDIPSGRYTVLIEKSETGPTTSQNTQIKLQLKILDTKYAKRTVYDSCVPGPTTYWKIKEWLTAVESDLVDAELTEEMVANALRGKTVTVQIDPSEYNGKTVYRCTGYKSANQPTYDAAPKKEKVVFGV